jgi:Flp pilus assembly protein TadG
MFPLAGGQHILHLPRQFRRLFRSNPLEHFITTLLFAGGNIVARITRSYRLQRRGAVVVLACLIMVVMLAFIAFSVDVGYICMARNQLQNSADSAAMAGAWSLLDERRLLGTGYVNQVDTEARAAAAQYAGLNAVCHAPPSVDQNAANSSSGEIVLGHLGSSGELDTAVSPANYNAVQVTVLRNQQRNGPLNLFFGRVLGLPASSAQATATAVFRDGINGFRATDTTGNTSLLPFALDIKAWQDLLNGGGTDQWSYNLGTEQVSSGADGVHELKLFPDKTTGGGIVPGNFGTVDIGYSGNSSADLKRQIREGVSASDLAYHGGELKAPVSLNGDTGVGVDISAPLGDIVGQARTIPLYDTVAGSGNTGQYHIVAFAGIRIVDYRLTGSNKYILIQPAVVVDDSALDGGGPSSSYSVYQPVILAR